MYLRSSIVNQHSIIGFPSLYGGAGAELHFIPTQKNVQGATLYHEMLERSHIIHEVYDVELGMVYYNYRHYNPSDGKWIGRDPITEDGGFNLYVFIENSILNSIDHLGLKHCHRDVILTHYGNLKSDKKETRNNKLKPGDVASRSLLKN